MDGAYRFTNGFSLIGLGSLAVAVLPNVPGFLVQVKVLDKLQVLPLFLALYNYAWFVGFAVAFMVYLTLRRLDRPTKRPLTGAAT